MDKMLTKFESKSNRVKGLSFHPVRPWILSSLHNGQIQLWDYRMGTCIDKYEEHDGPVRGIDFHKVQPLFVSGGDDYKVKVWDYKLRRCLFTLLGHLDYIRTVQFHSEYPWIVSASDDQTIRIWNWQSRNCISVLTGHNHYVMCASFHPKEDLIVSASLDQTVRVWDTTGLRKKTVRGPPSQVDDGNVVSRVNNELFGGNDALVKYVLEGHERGVNWAAFHPTLPLVVSGADDRQVKLWRMNETKAWEVDTMRGHTNNVSCVVFHPKQELIISNSEDRSIRVWDISKRIVVQTFRRDVDRFWILSAHPEQNLLAAGHDSGMIIFKLERERPAYDVIGNKCYYVKDRFLRLYDYSTSRDVPLLSLRRTTSTATPGIGGGPKTLIYNIFNKAENNILILSDVEGGSYELLTFTDTIGSDIQDFKRGFGLAAIFIARDRFVVLEKHTRYLLIKSFQNEIVKRISPPVNNIDNIFCGGISGRVILRTDDRIVLYDTLSRKIISELQVARVKYVIWNKDYSYIALLSKHQLVIANKQLEQICSINETVRLKGGSWDPNRLIFIYTTLNHIKYALCNGDHGILRGLEVPIYLTKIAGSNLYSIDREGKICIIEIDVTEALFKLALENKNYAEVMHMVRHSRLCGQAILNYLQEKGYPEVALHFVNDNKTKFKLALACGNIQIALSLANEIGDEAWKQLGIEALRQGNHEVVEMSYQKTKDFERLSFLYLITGNTEKLRKMLKISEMRNDVMSRYHNALYLGDAEERVKVLESTNNLSLAYLSASTHGLENDANRIKEFLESGNIPIPTVNTNASLLQPPTPIYKSENWPLLAVGKSSLLELHANEGSSSVSKVVDDDINDATGGTSGWDDDDKLLDDDEEDTKKKAPVANGNTKSGKGWEDDDDLDLSDDETSPAINNNANNASSGTFVAPTAGVSPTVSWISDSSFTSVHLAAGSVDTGLSLLHRQLALVNASLIKPGAISLFVGSSAYLPGLPLVPANRSFLFSSTQTNNKKPLPALTLKIEPLLEALKQAYKSFSSAQLQECKQSLETILQTIPITYAHTRTESNDIKELIDVSREYITAVRVKDAITAAGDDIVRGLELAAYFTHCNLQPSHLLLALKTAMANAFKNKNFINAASFARRLLELPDISTERHADLRSKAQKVLQKSEQQGRNEYKIDYDEMNPFSLDSFTLKPIYKGSPSVKCSYCSSTYSPQNKGKLCVTCSLCIVGVETVGLVTQTSSNRK